MGRKCGAVLQQPPKCARAVPSYCSVLGRGGGAGRRALNRSRSVHLYITTNVRASDQKMLCNAAAAAQMWIGGSYYGRGGRGRRETGFPGLQDTPGCGLTVS